MDDDLKSIAAARRAAKPRSKLIVLSWEPTAHVDAIVDAMARAIEPEAERLALAVEKLDTAIPQING